MHKKLSYSLFDDVYVPGIKFIQHNSPHQINDNFHDRISSLSKLTLDLEIGKESTGNESLWLALLQPLWCLSPLLILVIALFTTYPGAVNTVRALTDKPVRYSLSIPFIR